MHRCHNLLESKPRQNKDTNITQQQQRHIFGTAEVHQENTRNDSNANAEKMLTAAVMADVQKLIAFRYKAVVRVVIVYAAIPTIVSTNHSNLSPLLPGRRYSMLAANEFLLSLPFTL